MIYCKLVVAALIRCVNARNFADYFLECFEHAKFYLFVGCDMKKRIVAINERGLRVGEDHQNAKLTDQDVECIRELNRQGIGYGALAEKFEVSKSLIAKICTYQRRAETATNYKTVYVLA